MSRASLLAFGFFAIACSDRYADVASVYTGLPNTDDPPACKGSLATRLSVSTVTLPEAIRYKSRAYDNIMRDEALAFAISPSGTPNVAWLNNASNLVHVTQFRADSSIAQDVTLQGYEVGDLKMQSDGFMLLTSGPDPGEPLTDPNPVPAVTPAHAALLTRYRSKAIQFTVALTGTRQVGTATGAAARDCTPPELTGRLATNGSTYGAYFAVHGCQGHPAASQYADKLVYVNDAGDAVAGGYSWVCSISEGLQLLPSDTTPFAPFCFSAGTPEGGLNLLLRDGADPKLLSPEMHKQGYVGGQFGGVVKLSDGTFVAVWRSRGGPETTSPRPLMDDPDIAFLRLAADLSPIGEKLWLTNTVGTAEYNVHVAPYGKNQVLVIWDSVAVTSRRGETGFGNYEGTFAQLFDLTGKPLAEREQLNAPPNGSNDISVYGNGDLGWAFVPDSARSYSTPVSDGDAQSGMVRNELALARLTYCK